MASWNIPPGGATQKPAVVSLFLVDSLLDDLKDLTNHYDNGIADVKDQIVTIHEELTFLRTFLADMQVKSHHELEEFLAQIRDLAYEVEYIVNSFAPPWYLSIRLPQVLEKVKLVRTQLQERKSKYDSALQRVAQYPSQQAPLQYPLVGEEIFVGLEDEVAKIREQLVHGTEHLQIISVFGMPGLGKTTLAKKLYNDPFVLYHFDRRSWCAVSQTYERRNILTDILTSMYELDREAIMDMEDDTLGLKLYQRLKGRRYFIVMDDIWNVNAWDDMKRYFPDDRNGSRILFTTRLENVGSNASNRAFVHHLRFLTFEESWTLLQGKVFHKQPCPPDLVETGMKIAEDCDGLPLAVVVIAAVLANLEKKKSVWKEVARSVSSQMTKGQHEYQNILELSYNNLPMHLKPCFLYFGVFEEDKEIPVRKLILLWIAEGFIEKRSYRSSEDVAHEYLAELINRGLVLVSKRRSDGGVKACNIHDLLRDMCLRIGEKDKFMKSIQHQISIYEQHHRLSIHTRSNPSFSRPFGLHVRSVLGNLPDPSEFIISNLKLLKILDLSAMDLRMHNLTRNEVLVLLKFLSVSSIPSSLDIFENLEFLFVDNKDVVEIPDILLNIVKLKHMHFSGGAKFSDSLRERVAEDENCQMNNLENVSSVYLYDENDEKILKCSPHLKRLKCRFTAFWDSSENNYRYAALDFLHKLESLSIAFRPSYISDDDISPDLTSLPRNLRKLTLHNFELSRNQMRIIGKLLKLEVLKLRDNTFEDKLWCTSEDEFQELRFLELDGVQIEHWVASSDDFPKLECLVLRSCQHFEIPFNFADNLSLLKIEVHGCVNSIENSALAIQEEQKNMGNEEFKVIISRSQQ